VEIQGDAPPRDWQASVTKLVEAHPEVVKVKVMLTESWDWIVEPHGQRADEHGCRYHLMAFLPGKSVSAAGGTLTEAMEELEAELVRDAAGGAGAATTEGAGF